MNSENFMKRIEKCVLVAFNKRYSNKKMILILDNAAYHHVREERFSDLLLLKQAEMIDVLISKAKKVEMLVVRDGAEVTFNLAQTLKNKRGSKNSPTVTELRNKLQAGFMTTESINFGRVLVNLAYSSSLYCCRPTTRATCNLKWVV